ncbi:hypothetical protein AAFC00_001725 [Neodothiora populina]|uniref:Uncharacterized protein n=1 Tax=Neodothiora populina TaxID=2781224 RepID=A0ABR3PPY3_9PEZI
MFRASGRLRSLPSHTRVLRSQLTRRAPYSKSSATRSEHQALHPYKVRFQSPGWTPRRLATFSLYSACITGYLWYFAPEVEVEIQVEEQSQDGVTHASNDADFQPAGALEDSEFSEEDSFFIPLTWARKLPRTYYKGSDPEWQEFVKVAKDKPRHGRISNELADIVCQGSISHPIIAKQLGRDPKVGKYWLDMSFPDGPPQEYARRGIEVGQDFIALSTQKLSPEQQHRVTRALWPSATFNGLYASSKVLFAFQYRRLKQALGIESTPEPGSPEARMQHMLQMMQAQQEQGKLVPGKAKADTGSGASASAATSPSSSSSSASTTPESAAGKSVFPWLARAPTPATSTEMPLAMHIFNSTLAKDWMPKKMEPPRGTFIVQGLIQVKGSRAVMTFDVQGFYEPKSSKFVTVNATPRMLKRWNQAPRGGV